MYTYMYTRQKLRSKLDGYVYHVFWFLHVQPASQPTITVVALRPKQSRPPLLDGNKVQLRLTTTSVYLVAYSAHLCHVGNAPFKDFNWYFKLLWWGQSEYLGNAHPLGARWMNMKQCKRQMGNKMKASGRSPLQRNYTSVCLEELRTQAQNLRDEMRTPSSWNAK